MKQSVYLTPLFALAAAAGAAELGTMTIQNLPVSAEENRVVCYDSVSGKLGNCPGRETSIAVDCNIPGASIKDAIEKATTTAGVALTVNISGTCNETLEIERPNTQLLGDGTATIVGQNTSLGAITVITSPVEMENLAVAGGYRPWYNRLARWQPVPQRRHHHQRQDRLVGG